MCTSHQMATPERVIYCLHGANVIHSGDEFERVPEVTQGDLFRSD